MKPYEIVARRAESHSDEYYANKNKQGLNQGMTISAKDSVLNRILACISWLDRMPGRDDIKEPYVKRIWKAYQEVQEGNIDDTVAISEVLNTKRVERLEDLSPDVKENVGAFSSVKMTQLGTDYRGGKSDPYWKPPKKTKSRTLVGKELEDAYESYLQLRKDGDTEST